METVLDTQRVKKGEEIVGQLKGAGVGIKRSKQVSTRRGVGAGWSLLQRLAPDISTLDSILADPSTQDDILKPTTPGRGAHSQHRSISAATAKAEMDAAERAEKDNNTSLEDGNDNSFADVMNLVREGGSGRR